MLNAINATNAMQAPIPLGVGGIEGVCPARAGAGHSGVGHCPALTKPPPPTADEHP